MKLFPFFRELLHPVYSPLGIRKYNVLTEIFEIFGCASSNERVLL